ncbi:MAG TPA: hypothetical protein VEA38_25335 [Terriglobales bacterium]|nr:hypothetical protein [Terriglobales bacterium]
MTELELEGWVPGPEVPLAEIVDRAFDYRGNVTIERRDGSELTGYLFNRDARAATPFVQLFDTAGDGPFTVPYADIRTIRFTGKDTAAGNSYAAWLERKAAAKVEGRAAPQR